MYFDVLHIFLHKNIILYKKKIYFLSGWIIRKVYCTFKVYIFTMCLLSSFNREI